MQRLGLTDGDRVRMWNQHGEIVLRCRAAGSDELPSGLLFLPYGNMSSQLMGPDTHGTGMPDSKGLDVLLEKAR
jgi:formylmethanofuran dehydrogenase subunit D